MAASGNPAHHSARLGRGQAFRTPHAICAALVIVRSRFRTSTISHAEFLNNSARCCVSQVCLGCALGRRSKRPWRTSLRKFSADDTMRRCHLWMTKLHIFFSTLTDMLLDLSRETLSRRPIFHLVGGEALELWMLKVACGIYFSVAAKDNVRIAERYSIDLKKVERAFFDGVWDNRVGLHFRGETGSVVDVAHGLALHL